ncbi:MAG: Heavy metal transport/detoxification protein [uncultured bacterium (gcode 4)]|uniref:Heavy metal transport/detoxification protein n=1 Tax=uncultured bacterium (gcode 4) TaxID=1234023 RepID=K2G201_9BACT|nr:MAG: Heavy metal transport/detoxification protein [uncultured bacterium (gcode 4)]
MKKINIDVTGMHCRSCEMLLEKSLKKAKNVTHVNANEKKWTIELWYEWSPPHMSEVQDIIENAWYELWKAKPLTWLNTDKSVYNDFIMILFTLFAVYLVLSAFWIDIWGVWSFSNPTFWVALLVWLTAGISSCMALVGWLVLWVSSKWSENNANLSGFAKFEPHLYFNLWRIIGFWLLWWMLGVFWQIFSLSPFMIWIMTVVTGLVMLFLGINLSELSPKLSNLSLTLPKSLWKNVWRDIWGSKHIFAFSTWALTFFLPCWFTLAMQAYAITTGNFMQGALIMMAFAIGTAPGLLWVWGLSSFFSWKKAKKIFKTTWAIVILLAIFNISNWYNLMSLGWISGTQTAVEANPWEIQEIRMTQDWSWYSPSELRIKPNTKTRWIITSTNPFSCATQFMAPSIWVNKTLVKWENVIEFISPASWEIKFSCSMWMYGGRIIIEWDWSPVSAITTSSSSAVPKGCSAWWAGWPATSGVSKNWWWCSMMNWSSPQPTGDIAIIEESELKNAEQINAIYTSAWMSPNEFSLKKWTAYTLTIDVKESIYWCMSQIYIPWFDENIQTLEGWTKVKFTFKAGKSGQYPLVCGMWMPHWYLNIN